jgi:hypothetical protein
MKRIVLLFGALSLTGCFGYSSKQNELTGQVKKIKNQTPLICPNRVDVDISLGIIRNGVGSMSAQDLWLTVENENDVKALAEAAESGKLVKISYDVRRVTICSHPEYLTRVEILK